MADDNKDPKDDKGGDKGPQPGVDADAIRAVVQDALANWTPPEPERRPEPRPQPQGDDPLADLIGSRVNPALKHLGYEIADAKDASLFYVGHPEAVKHKAAVEEAFNRLKQQGTPMARAAVWDWYKGKNFDQFRKEAAEAEKEAERRAREAGDTGPGAARHREVQTKDPHTMSDEELSKAMEGVAF